MVLKLVVGLGNPGPEYAETRHNAGFWFLDRLASRYQGGFFLEKKFFAQTARVHSDGMDCRLMKPVNFMNNSGKAVQAICGFYAIKPQEILVVHDDIDLPPGTVRLKAGGGHGGHNGLRDIIEQAGIRDFLRLRIGVGHPGHKEDVVDYVLHNPSADEKKLLDAAVDNALEIMPLVFDGEIERAMTRLHTSEKLKVQSEKKI